MDLINNIKWTDKNGTQTAEASFEIMELHISNPELFRKNNIVLDEYGVLCKIGVINNIDNSINGGVDNDLKLHTLGIGPDYESEWSDASNVGFDSEDMSRQVDDSNSVPLNAKNHIDDEKHITTGLGNMKLEKNLSNNSQFLKNAPPGFPQKSRFDRQIETNPDIGWTETPLTKKNKQNPNQKIDETNEEVNEENEEKNKGLAELHKFLKEEDSENQEDIKDIEKVISEEEKAILKATKIKYKDELLPYQINHVKKLVSGLRNYQNAFDGSETGTGKTHSALVTAKNLGYNVVVICPKPVIYTWYEAMKLHGFKVCYTKEETKKVKRWGYVSNYEQFKNGNTAFLKVKTVEGDTVFRWDKFPEKTLLIVDEIQKAKNYKTKNSELLYQAHNAKVPTLMLSATAVDKVEFMYTLGFMLDLYRSVVHFKQWVRTKKIEAPSEVVPEKHCMTLLHKHIFPKRGSRMTIKDAGDSFPKNYVIWEPYVNEKIKEVLVLFEKRIKKIMKAKGESECMLTAILRARQETELLKVPYFIETAHDLVAEGKSVAIFLNFKESIEYVARALDTDCIIWGDNTTEEREKYRKKFVKNKEKIIICNIASGGVGISLHDTSEGGKHPRVSLINPTWSAQDIKQTLGRVFRSGATSKCIQKIIYAPGTVEEKLMEVVKFKLNNIEILNDGPVYILKEILGIAKPVKPKKKEKSKKDKKKSKKEKKKSKKDKSSSSSLSDESDEQDEDEWTEPSSTYDDESSDNDKSSVSESSIESKDDESSIESSESSSSSSDLSDEKDEEDKSQKKENPKNEKISKDLRIMKDIKIEKIVDDE